MMSVDFQQLARQIAHPDPNSRTAARMIVYAMQEEAVDPLVDQFYSGVSDAEGIAILDVIAKIGGPDAMAVLRNIFAFEEERPAIKLAAALGLLRNRGNLSLREMDEVALYLKDAYDD